MASIPSLPQSGLAYDSRSLDALRSRAAGDPKAAVKEAAKQFETLFMNELMKSMRSTTMQTGMLENAGSGMGTEMLDTQFASQMSGRPGGLSDAIMKQLERQMGLSPGPIPVTGSANNLANGLVTGSANGAAATLSATPQPTRIPQTGALGFVQQHSGAAQEAEAATGIPAAFMVSQAALETGWGRKEIRHGDGQPSYNLFGIKAGGSWKGPVAEVTTTEYINGKAQKMLAKFRAYGSYAESFTDYAKLMKESPRYQAAVGGARGESSGERTGHTVAQADRAAHSASAFAQGLQKAGYATDPAYADKLTRVINTTLRLQRSLA